MATDREITAATFTGLVIGLPVGFAFSLFPQPAWMDAVQFHVIRVVGTTFALGIFAGIVIGAMLAWRAGAGAQQHHHFHDASDNRPTYKGL